LAINNLNLVLLKLSTLNMSLLDGPDIVSYKWAVKNLPLTVNLCLYIILLYPLYNFELHLQKSAVEVDAYLNYCYHTSLRGLSKRSMLNLNQFHG
jgi:hypothetical protein